MATEKAQARKQMAYVKALLKLNSFEIVEKQVKIALLLKVVCCADDVFST